jgi:hypothetical protein
VDYSRIVFGGYDIWLAIGVTYILGIGLIVYWGLEYTGSVQHNSRKWEYTISAIVLILGISLITLFSLGRIP